MKVEISQITDSLRRQALGICASIRSIGIILGCLVLFLFNPHEALAVGDPQAEDDSVPEESHASAALPCCSQYGERKGSQPRLNAPGDLEQQASRVLNPGGEKGKDSQEGATDQEPEGI